ncbi:MAG TPA: AAA family ATPase, partial [Acidimicrobiales bacterium]|nr:AAA family ATPase [Acidimicrobiales bacterium]
MSTSEGRRSPYQGLVPYAEEDASYFFGRDQECDLVVANLLACRLTLLYGPSGVGKTSLLHAGVVHHLRSPAAGSIARRGVPLATAVFSSWRDDPLEGLVSSIAQAMAHVRGQLYDTSDIPASPLHQAIQTATRRGELLIILDQFEEYFLYHDQ